MDIERSSYELYQFYEAQAEGVTETACLLYMLTADGTRRTFCLNMLEAYVHATTERTRQIANIQTTDAHSVLSLHDRLTLCEEIEKIVGTIDGIATNLECRQPTRLCPTFESLVCLLVAVAQETGVLLLQIPQNFCRTQSHTVVAGIKALSLHASHTFQQATAALEADRCLEPLRRRQWREIYERLLQAIDRCASLATFLESLAPACAA